MAQYGLDPKKIQNVRVLGLEMLNHTLKDYFKGSRYIKDKKKREAFCEAEKFLFERDFLDRLIGLFDLEINADYIRRKARELKKKKGIQKRFWTNIRRRLE